MPGIGICKGSGDTVTLDDIKKDVVARDESDMMRSVGALKVADDAIVIDTTDLSIDGVVDKVLAHIKRADHA